VEAKIRRQR